MEMLYGCRTTDISWVIGDVESDGDIHSLIRTDGRSRSGQIRSYFKTQFSSFIISISA